MNAKGQHERQMLRFWGLSTKKESVLDKYGWSIFKLKWEKTVERTYLGTSKQQIRYSWCFDIWKCLANGKNWVSGFCQQTNKVKYMYLPFENLQKSSKNGQKKSESQKKSTNDGFRG